MSELKMIYVCKTCFKNTTIEGSSCHIKCGDEDLLEMPDKMFPIIEKFDKMDHKISHFELGLTRYGYPMLKIFFKNHISNSICYVSNNHNIQIIGYDNNGFILGNTNPIESDQIISFKLYEDLYGNFIQRSISALEEFLVSTKLISNKNYILPYQENGETHFVVCNNFDVLKEFQNYCYTNYINEIKLVKYDSIGRIFQSDCKFMDNEVFMRFLTFDQMLKLEFYVMKVSCELHKQTLQLKIAFTDFHTMKDFTDSISYSSEEKRLESLNKLDKFMTIPIDEIDEIYKKLE